MARATPQPFSNAEILKRLHAFGYFGSRTWVDVRHVVGAELMQALKHYQEFHGLKPDGIPGPRTAHVLQRRRCGLPDFNMTDGESCKWPHRNITYYTSINLPGLTESQVDQAFDTAFAQWAAVCNIEPMRVEAANKANIYSRSGVGKKHHLDDKGGTLAWSELPCGVASNMQLDQMYDEAEDWSYNMAIAVMCHEIGHALGLPHLTNGNLMAPYYDPNVTKPQKGDIKEIAALYGKRRKKSPRARAALLEVTGTLMINDRPYVLVPQT